MNQNIQERKIMKIHPVAELFPMLSSSELNELAESIKKEGLLNPCVMKGDTLLDGRNRIAACRLAGVAPRFVEYTGNSPVAFIIGANLARRHLDKGQKIALALEIEPHFAEEARKRQLATLKRGDVLPDVEKVPQREKSRDQAAAAVGVSGTFRVLIPSRARIRSCHRRPCRHHCGGSQPQTERGREGQRQCGQDAPRKNSRCSQ